MFTDGTELRKLLAENPDLPLLVFATDDANHGEYSCELAELKCRKGSVLDCPKEEWLPFDDRIYTDYEDLESDVVDVLHDDYGELSDEEFNAKVAEHMRKLDQYWKECIIITCDDY